MARALDLSRLSLTISLGFLSLLLVYYLSTGWLYVGLVDNRVLRFYVSINPFTGFVTLDYIALLLLGLLVSRAVSIGLRDTMIFLSWVFLVFLSIVSTGYTELQILYSPAIAYLLYRSSGRLLRNMGWVDIVSGFLIAASVASLPALYMALASIFSSHGFGHSTELMIRQRLSLELVGRVSIALAPFLGIYMLIQGMGALKKHGGEDLGRRLSRRAGGSAAQYIAIVIGITGILAALIITHRTVEGTIPRVSVDTIFYMDFIRRAEEKGLLEALREYSGFARPVYLALLYLVSRMGIDPLVLMDIAHPALALSLLVIATWYLARRTASIECSIHSAILTGYGPTTLTFISAGYQANSIALPLAIMLMTRGPRIDAAKTAILASMVLTHPWVYAIYSVSYIAALAIHYRARYREIAANIALVVALWLAAEAVSSSITGAHPSMIVASTIADSITHQELYPGNIYRAIDTWAWGTLANPAIYILTAIALTEKRIDPTRITAIITLTPTIITDSVIAHRLILNTPKEILAASALEKLDMKTKAAVYIIIATYYITTLQGLTPLTK